MEVSMLPYIEATKISVSWPRQGQPGRARVEAFEKREIIAIVPEYMVAPEHRDEAVGSYDDPTGHNLPAG